MDTASLNLELKVQVDPAFFAKLRGRLTANGQPYQRLSHVDTYFPTSHGRLKLRQITHDDSDVAASAELISYERPNHAQARWSHYHLVSVPIAMVEGLRFALAAALGLGPEVRKSRVVVIVDQTRIHLDVVDNLGTFIELETLANDRPGAEVEAELLKVARYLGIDSLEPIAGSYGELLSA